MGQGQSRTAGISNEAVRSKTGKGWEEWFVLLDRAGAREMSHKEIARYLHDRQGVGEWWAQMVTVGYEQARGRRQAHQKTDGFSASASRTFPVSLERLYEAWSNGTQRKAWLGDAIITIRKETENKSMRITWNAADGAATNLEVNFYAKGEGKSQLALEHSKLPAIHDVETKKEFWKAALDRLGAHLLR
jgi:uncharacterized protein YndB with AHSA1/START domain